MRDRRKKHLGERLEAVESVLFTPVYDDRTFSTAILKPEYLDLAGYFGNDNPLMLEIGCGKGTFVCESAKQHPELNYIAVEKVGNVLVTACERALNEGLR
ncbi:MAG: tRNA (guanosine(46)-N7)-methyltransferase TrmB, partial [Clostridia bacterium]|nr:tRNA (guanosine(46)-N7)-methyltransferase TrmB [Clostridia bacterium]